MFKTIALYIKLYYNRAEIVRLDNGMSINRSAKENFSNSRIVLADFLKFENFIRPQIAEVMPANKLFAPQLIILFQVKEDVIDGLCSVEKRALLDSGEHAGAKEVYIYEGSNDLTISQALNYIQHT